MIDILSYWKQGRKTKVTSSGWISGNAPCCNDKRGRGGIKTTDDGWVYHCFNCNFKATFKVGRPLSANIRKLLSLLHLDKREIELLNLESLKHRSLADLLPTTVTHNTVSFEPRPLPNTTELISDTNQDLALVEYLRNRGFSLNDYPFMKDTAQTRAGILIPYMYKNQIVGHTIRFLDDRKPKYLSDQPSNFIFGVDSQDSSWAIAVVVEGIFDAISINGIGLLHSTISKEQAQLLKSLGKEIIVVPDQDIAGLAIVDKAIELGFSVSMPSWEGCKDVNDAVCKYGRLTTLLSIIANKETNRIKIEMRKKQLAKSLSEKNVC